MISTFLESTCRLCIAELQRLCGGFNSPLGQARRMASHVAGKCTVGPLAFVCPFLQDAVAFSVRCYKIRLQHFRLGALNTSDWLRRELASLKPPPPHDRPLLGP